MRKKKRKNKKERGCEEAKTRKLGKRKAKEDLKGGESQTSGEKIKS